VFSLPPQCNNTNLTCVQCTCAVAVLPGNTVLEKENHVIEQGVIAE
jgi:hypothetical protein